MVTDLFTVRDDGTIVLAVHVQPGAGKSAAAGRHGDALKVRVAAQPEGGRANTAVAKLLATELGVADSAVTLVSGAKSRAKRLSITGVEEEDFVRVLERLVTGTADPGGRAHDPHGGRRP